MGITKSPGATGLRVYQANHECTWYNCYVLYSPSPGKLEAVQAKKCANLQAHCIILSKVVGIDCGFSLTGNSVRYIYSKGYTLTTLPIDQDSQ